MWLLVTLAAILATAAAHESLSAEFKQRLVDIFGEPGYLDDALDPVTPGNGTDCVCMPYAHCRVTNDSSYWSDDLKARHMSCANVFDWCCEAGRERRVRRPARAGCGWGAPTARGSRVAGPEEFPWVVAILDKTAGKTWTPRQLVGTGSIIHPSVVLTAAHKVFGRDHTKLKCRAGEYNASSAAERLPHQDRGVSAIVTHEGYYRPQMANSVALVILATPFDLAHFPHVGAACVAAEMPPPGTVCFGTGWGKLEYGDRGKYSQVLKKVELPLVEQAECERRLRGSRLGAGFRLHRSLACAGGAGGARGADTCTGDGGAPLVCPIGSTGQRFAIVGMAAWGVGCGGERPAAYARAPLARAWAAQALAARGLAIDLRYTKE